MSDDSKSGDAIELLRVELVGDDELHIQPGAVDIFQDAAVWGEVLANIAAQIALTLEATDGRDANKTLRAIAEKFAREVAKGPGAAR